VSAAVQHPAWCFLGVCTAAEGGQHTSTSRVVPEEPVAAAGQLLVVDLVQPADGGPRLRLRHDGRTVLLLTLRGAYVLSTALRDLATIGRRAER
jgi:hypothetical protein